MKKLEVQIHHPNLTFVRSTMIPSMWSGTYSVKLFSRTKQCRPKWLEKYAKHHVNVLQGEYPPSYPLLPFPSLRLYLHVFSCHYYPSLLLSHSWLSRLSACCLHRHVSALLHALVSLTHSAPCPGSDVSSDEETTPCKHSCKWKPPCKQKATAQKVSATTFQKHEYGRTKQYTIQSMETFDPQPESMRDTASLQLLEGVRGKGLCISLLLRRCICACAGEATTQTTLSKAKLLEKIRNS